MNNEKPPLDPHPLSDYVSWAGHRNRTPILEVLKEKLPKETGQVLELATGSGMHINYFAPHFKHLDFHPTDKDKEVFDTIKKLSVEQGNDNVVDPSHLDLTQPETWLNVAKGKLNTFSAMFCINIFQVAPISIAEGMMDCASKLLATDGFLLIYGPFQIGGTFSTQSNQKFHNTLASAGVSEWGLKDITDLQAAAKKYDLELSEKIDMPANNFSLIFTRK